MLERVKQKSQEVFIRAEAAPNVRDITSVIYGIENCTGFDLELAYITVKKATAMTFGTALDATSSEDYYEALCKAGLTTQGIPRFIPSPVQRGEYVYGCLEVLENLPRFALVFRFENMQTGRKFNIPATAINRMAQGFT